MDEDSQKASEDDARAPFATVLVAQHLHRSRETRITAILSRATALTVTLAQGGKTPRAGTVHFAPPDRHLCPDRGRR